MLDLSKEIILEAQSNTKSNSEAARWLGINYLTYRKYAKMYDLFDGHLNQKGVGISKGGWNIKTHKTIKKQVKSVRQKLHICRECGDTDLSNFYFHIDTRVRTNKKYYKKDCKSCLSKVRKERWINDDEYRNWYLNYKKKNKERIRKTNKKYWSKNRDKILASQKRYYYENGGKERLYEYQKEYHKQPHIAAARFIRGEVHRVLSKIGTKKEKHSVQYVDYTPNELRLHIESLFQPGMAWGNHGWGKGKWQIDHKKEVAQYIREGITDVNIINRLDNLQPLWTEEHALKTASFIKRNNKKL